MNRPKRNNFHSCRLKNISLQSKNRTMKNDKINFADAIVLCLLVIKIIQDGIEVKWWYLLLVFPAFRLYDLVSDKAMAWAITKIGEFYVWKTFRAKRRALNKK